MSSVRCPVSVGMQDKQGKAPAVLKWQKGKDSLCQRNLGWICDGASVDQESLLRSNKQIEKISFRIDAGTLTKDESLRFVAVHLQRSLRRRCAIRRTDGPLRGQRSGDGLRPCGRSARQYGCKPQQRLGPCRLKNFLKAHKHA